MTIALMAHDNKKELLVQFCTAYCGILSKHNICATSITGRMVADATGLPIHLFLSHTHGGIQQIGARLSYGEIDLVLNFDDPNDPSSIDDLTYIAKLCDLNSIPLATNVATAEMLVLGLARGDLDWRCIVNPSTRPIA